MRGHCEKLLFDGAVPRGGIGKLKPLLETQRRSGRLIGAERTDSVAFWRCRPESTGGAASLDFCSQAGRTKAHANKEKMRLVIAKSHGIPLIFLSNPPAGSGVWLHTLDKTKGGSQREANRMISDGDTDISTGFNRLVSFALIPVVNR